MGIFKSSNIYVKAFCYIIHRDLGPRPREVFSEVKHIFDRICCRKKVEERCTFAQTEG